MRRYLIPIVIGASCLATTAKAEQFPTPDFGHVKEVVPSGKHRTARHVAKPSRRSSAKVVVAAKRSRHNTVVASQQTRHHSNRSTYRVLAKAGQAIRRRAPTPALSPDNPKLINVAMSDLGGNPTGWRSKWCAKMLNMWLAEIGLRPNGSNAAISFKSYGAPTFARPGAIAVMAHHVGIVKEVGPGYVTLVSGNHGRKVGVGKYPTAKIVAFRAPL